MSPHPQSTVDQRYRCLYKPALFAACLLPFAGCVGGIVAISGFPQVPDFDLGVDPVRFVLDTLGKTTINLLLMTLSVTPLRQLTGNAHLIRLRRMLGLFVLFYALMHFAIYVGPFQDLSWHAISKDILKRPYITIGFVALLLLPLAVTSTHKMMRRLKRRWQQLHRLIYLIAMLALLHFWKMLKNDYRQPLIYAGILAALLLWRMWRHYRPAYLLATSQCALPKAREIGAAAAPSPDS